MKLLILFMILSCFSASGILLYGFAESDNYDGCYQYKLNLLKSCPKNVKKVVAIGGSSTNFGFHADLFEQETSIRTFNMGFSAGVSFDSYLESITPYLNNGDIVLMLPEADYYNHAIHAYSMETTVFNMYCDKDASVLRFEDSWKYLTNTITQGWNGWWNSISFYSKYIISKMGFHDLSVYDFYECNNNGDLLNHMGRDRVDFIQDYQYKIFNPSVFISEMNDYFENRAPQISIEAFFVPTPIIMGSFNLNQNSYMQLFETINDASDIKMLCNFSDVIFEYDDFFDTQYHLTYESGIEYTRTLIQSFSRTR